MMTVNTLNIVAHGPHSFTVISELLHKRLYTIGVRDDAPYACGVAHVVCDRNGQI